MRIVLGIGVFIGLLICCENKDENTEHEIFLHYRFGGEETARLLVKWQNDSTLFFDLNNQSIACDYETNGVAIKKSTSEEKGKVVTEDFETKSHPHLSTFRFYQGKRDSLTLIFQPMDSIQGECLPKKDMEFFTIP
jgi:hypothetical protein